MKKNIKSNGRGTKAEVGWEKERKERKKFSIKKYKKKCVRTSLCIICKNNKMLRIHDKNVKEFKRGGSQGVDHSICVSYNFQGWKDFYGKS